MSNALPDDPKMPSELKAEWLAALRSGKYDQARGALRKDGCYCCLGVLCDLIDPSGWGQDGSDPDEFSFEGDVMSGSLPISMNRRFLPTSLENSLITMNDKDMASFAAIADWIEANV